jgi:hypothetical protein
MFIRGIGLPRSDQPVETPVHSRTAGLLARGVALGRGVETALVMALALAVCLAAPNQPPTFDELYHYFAAESLSRDGIPAVIDGEYRRALLFTELVAALFKLFGTSLDVARLPALAAETVLVGVLFTWCWQVMDRRSAWISAALLLTCPISIELSNVVRFYSIHALLVVLGILGIRALVDSGTAPRGRRLILAAGGLLCLGVAANFQKSTVIAILALAGWCAAVFARRAWVRGLPYRRHLAQPAIVLWIGFAGLALALLLNGSGLLDVLWHEYRFSAAWSAPGKDNFIFYQQRLTADYPVLLPLLPLAILVGLVRHPRPIALATAIFLIGVLAHSFAGMKADRYIYWLMPFFFMIWGSALGWLVPTFFRFVTTLARQAIAQGRPETGWRTGLSAVAPAVILFAVLCNPLPPRLLVPSRVTEPGLDWSDVPRDVIEAVRGAGIVLATDEMRTAYYFGRVDVTASAGRLAELEDQAEFTVDRRTGLPVVSTRESLERIWACFDTGVLVQITSFWRNSLYLGESMDFVVRNADALPIDPRLDLSVFRWRRPPGPLPDDCMTLPDMLKSRISGEWTGATTGEVP